MLAKIIHEINLNESLLKQLVETPQLVRKLFAYLSLPEQNALITFLEVEPWEHTTTNIEGRWGPGRWGK